MPVNKSPQASVKKVQLDKNKTIIFAIVSVAAVVTVAALMIGKGIWTQTNYLGKVASMKEDAKEQLIDNKEALGELEAAYKTFAGQNPNLLGGTPDGTGERDGSNATLILDALPSKYDFPALTSSIEKLLTGYAINDITGLDDSLVQQSAPAEGPVEMPFSLGVTTSYDGFKQLITSFNKSIRPFQIVKVELTGTNTALQTQIEAKTYYQMESGLKIKQETVR